MTEEHRALRELLGAYALGQLAADERAELDRHLPGCADCRAELDGLAPVAAALRGLDPDAAAAPAVPPELGDRVVGRIQRQRQERDRRRLARRAVGGLLVAASLAAAFGIGTWWAGPRNDPPVVAVDLRVADRAVAADAGLVKHTWGTELKLTATGLVDGASYRVTFVTEDGTRVDGGTFLGTGARPLRCSMNGALPIDDAARVSIADAAGTVVMDAAV